MSYWAAYHADHSRPGRNRVLAIGLSLLFHGVVLGLLTLMGLDWYRRPVRVTDTPGVGSVLVLPREAPAEEKVAEHTPDQGESTPPPALALQEANQQSVQTPAQEAAEAPLDSTFGDEPPASQSTIGTPTGLIEGTGDVTWTSTGPASDTPTTRASFAGVEATPARRVVYVIDASGAMASSLRFVTEELARSVSRLSPEQSFQVVVFRHPVNASTPAVSCFYTPGGTPSLTQATSQAKLDLVRWLANVQPSGRSDPLVGLEAALSMNPDLIFLLTRSIQRSAGFDAQSNIDRVLASLDSLNRTIPGAAHRSASIKTIQFLEDDPTGLLQAIAKQHGDGADAYRVITRAEINTIRKNANE